MSGNRYRTRKSRWERINDSMDRHTLGWPILVGCTALFTAVIWRGIL